MPDRRPDLAALRFGYQAEEARLRTAILSQFPNLTSASAYSQAVIVQVSGQPEISRDNLQQVVAVTGRIEGRGLGAAIADVTKVLAAPGMLPAAMRYELGGLYRQQQIAFAGLTRVFAAALVAEFILLLVLYERF